MDRIGKPGGRWNVRLVRGGRIGSALALLGLFLAACQPAALPAPTVAAPVPPSGALPTPTVGAVTSEATIAATASVTDRPPRTALEATDPSSVSLANGRPTLVEFFAFW
jgi:hypothetical protein